MTPLRVGRHTLYILDDGTFSFPAHFFFRNVAEELWRPHLDLDGAGKIRVGHNYAVLETDNDLIVFDTGYGDDTHGGQSGHLLADLGRAGFRREQVTKVVLTHAHGDHIKGNTVVEGGARVPTFPRARYHLARADWDWFRGPGRVPEFDEQLATLECLGRVDLVDGELQLTPEVRLVPTPGHTPGHTTAVIASRGSTAIFLGDLCHLPLHVAHLEWVSTFDTDPERTPAMRAKIFTFAVERNAVIVCPHAPSPGLGRVTSRGGGFRWEPL
jgi:glyoxylase-like metal-dependent hydrolase (beta-lactamase superfamily II)